MDPADTVPSQLFSTTSNDRRYGIDRARIARGPNAYMTFEFHNRRIPVWLRAIACAFTLLLFPVSRFAQAQTAEAETPAAAPQNAAQPAPPTVSCASKPGELRHC